MNRKTAAFLFIPAVLFSINAGLSLYMEKKLKKEISDLTAGTEEQGNPSPDPLRMQRLKESVGFLETRFLSPTPGTSTLSLILETIGSSSLKLDEYRVSRENSGNGEHIKLLCSGRAEAVMAFLSGLSFPDCRIGSIVLTRRTGEDYSLEVHISSLDRYSPNQVLSNSEPTERVLKDPLERKARLQDVPVILSRLFFRYPVQSRLSNAPAESRAEQVFPLLPPPKWLSRLGTEGGTAPVYLFLDSRTGRVYPLSPGVPIEGWLLYEEENRHRLRIEENIYDVGEL